MTKKELLYIKKILELIKDKDNHIALALSYVNKNLTQYESRKGQLQDNYEPDWHGM